jgi:hypothetical protein
MELENWVRFLSYHEYNNSAEEPSHLQCQAAMLHHSFYKDLVLHNAVTLLSNSVKNK